MNVAVQEFPFVAELPKRAKSKVATLWDEFEALSVIARQRGAYLPSTIAGDLLGVSQQRVSELATAGRFETVTIGGRRFVLEESIIEYAKTERKSGRPWPQTKQAAKAVRRPPQKTSK